jgi:membrane protein required for colicin V production
VVSIITVKISDLILDSRIGRARPTLGFVFGAGRGLLICVIGWVFLAWLVQGKMPEWASTARSRPAGEHRQPLIDHAARQPGRACSSSSRRRGPRATRPTRGRPEPRRRRPCRPAPQRRRRRPRRLAARAA